MAALVPLDQTIVESQAELRQQTTPMAKSLVLTYCSDMHLFTTNTMMRFIATLAPGRNILGTTDVEKANVDGWLDFIWWSLDVPLAADPNADISVPLETLNKHLQCQTHLVGKCLTIADISLFVTLQMSAADQLSNYENVHELYKTVQQHPAVAKALAFLKET